MINKFAVSVDLDCSREFIYNNVVSNQLMIIKSINALINPTALNPSEVIEQFFTKYN